MYKVLALYPPPADPDQFRRYYEGTHLPIARRMPGLEGWRYSFSVEALEGAAPYFCVWEGEFADRAAFEAAVASPEGQATAADIANYATGGVVLLHYPATEG